MGRYQRRLTWGYVLHRFMGSLLTSLGLPSLFLSFPILPHWPRRILCPDGLKGKEHDGQEISTQGTISQPNLNRFFLFSSRVLYYTSRYDGSLTSFVRSSIDMIGILTTRRVE